METHIINGKTHYTLSSRHFKVNSKRFEVVATDITGRGPMDCVHTVKGETETKQVKHQTIVALFKQKKLSY